VETARSVLSRPLFAASVAIYSTVALAAFEGTAVAAALPQVVADLGRIDLLPWVVTGYLFASGVATVVSGPLVDRFGIRLVFQIAVIVFTLAGTGAGLVDTMPLMVTARLLQGVGSGMVLATALAAVSLIYPDHLVGRAFAANSTVWGVMGASAPAIAAFMITSLSWRWIFFANLPLGLVAYLTGRRVMPGRLEQAETNPIDVRGGILLALFTLAMVLAVDEISLLSFLWVAVAAGVVFVYAWHARRRPRPVLLAEHIVHQPYGTLGLSVTLLIVAAFSANTYLTLYVSAGRGGSATLTAWSVFFFVVGWTLGANVSSRLLDRIADSSVMIIGMVVTVPGLLLCAGSAWWTWPLPVVFVGMGMAGGGIGMATNAALTLLRVTTPPESIGRVTSAHQFMRNQGFTLGSALGGAILLLVIGRRLESVDAVQQLLAGTGDLDPALVSGAVRDAYAWTALVAAAISATAAIPMRSLRRHLAPARAIRRGRAAAVRPPAV
jgi:MFS family permease